MCVPRMGTESIDSSAQGAERQAFCRLHTEGIQGAFPMLVECRTDPGYRRVLMFPEGCRKMRRTSLCFVLVHPVLFPLSWKNGNCPRVVEFLHSVVSSTQ